MLSRLMTRREQLVLAGLAGALVLGSIVLYVHGRRAEANVMPAASAPPVPVGVRTPGCVPTPALTVPDPGPVLPLPAVVPPVPSASSEEPHVVSEPSAEPISVSVVGAVRKPGVYAFDGEARVRDAIAKAGNETLEADLTDINLAAKLMDATTLAIPARGGTAVMTDGTLVARGSQSAVALNIPEYTISGSRSRQPVRMPTGPAPTKEEPAPVKAAVVSGGANDGKVNLNTASASELEALPGIGPKLAEQIISYRSQTPFASIEDLDKVGGIGAKRLESLRGLVTVK